MRYILEQTSLGYEVLLRAALLMVLARVFITLCDLSELLRELRKLAELPDVKRSVYLLAELLYKKKFKD